VDEDVQQTARPAALVETVCLVKALLDLLFRGQLVLDDDSS
jgi:hypothetical protein